MAGSAQSVWGSEIRRRIHPGDDGRRKAFPDVGEILSQGRKLFLPVPDWQKNPDIAGFFRFTPDA
jgi:hypothetical protein